MASDMQTKTLETVVEMGRTKKKIIKGQILKKVGYGKSIQEHPDRVFESKGFLQLADELGLTDDMLTKALVADIKKKPGKRTKELELGFKVRGRLKGNEEGNIYNTFNFLSLEQTKRVARRIQNGDPAGTGEPDRLLNSDEPQV